MKLPYKGFNQRVKLIFAQPGPEGSRIWVCRPLYRSHFKVSKGPKDLMRIYNLQVNQLFTIFVDTKLTTIYI